jgi:hypothetical protein
MQLINVGLIKHPLNWFTVGLMILLAAIAGHLLLSYIGVEPATDNQ